LAIRNVPVSLNLYTVRNIEMISMVRKLESCCGSFGLDLKNKIAIALTGMEGNK
jgi:hypothetical protein